MVKLTKQVIALNNMYFYSFNSLSFLAGGTLDEGVQAQGFALTCCSYPRSDVVVRSIDEDELVSAQFKRE